MRTAGWTLCFLLNPLFGQTPSVVTSVGYSAPPAVAVAPGQIVTLFAHTKTKLDQSIIAPAGSTLPNTLGGFSVSLAETFSTLAIPVPVLSVAPVENCSAVVPDCIVSTAITVQIPFELVPNVRRSRQPANSAALTVSDNGDTGESIALNPVSDRIHIVNSCDTPRNAPSGPCQLMFLHADGSLVSSENPATAGETIALQAYGLGYADSRIATGALSPSPAVSVSGVSVDFRFGPDPAVTRPGANAGTLSAQLVPGSVGLYQLAFPVPAIPDGTSACSAVATNLTVVIGRGASFDGAGLCAQAK